MTTLLEHNNCLLQFAINGILIYAGFMLIMFSVIHYAQNYADK